MSATEMPIAGSVVPGEVLLIREDALLPGSFNLNRHPLWPGWVYVPFRAAVLERQLTQLGWHLFFIVPEIEVAAFALDAKCAVQKATLRALREAEARKLNALEITKLAVKHFSGIHDATIIAKLRHVQDSPILSEAHDRRDQGNVRVEA